MRRILGSLNDSTRGGLWTLKQSNCSVSSSGEFVKESSEMADGRFIVVEREKVTVVSVRDMYV
jgi:hypothetical protein